MASYKFGSDDLVCVPCLKANGSNWVLYKARLTWAAAAKGVAGHLDGKLSAPVAPPPTAGQDATAAEGATPQAPDVTAAQTGATTAGGHAAALATWEKGEAAVKDLESRKLPGTIELVTIDTTKDDTINAAAENVEKKHGKLDVLINNAAVAVVEGSLREQMNASFDTNATGALVISQAFLPYLSLPTYYQIKSNK